MTSFSEQIRRVHDKRNFKIKNSYGCRDYYRYYCHKHKTNLPENMYRQILSDIVLQLINEYLLKFLRISLPCKMGELYVKEYTWQVIKKSDGTYTKRTPVDWNKTLQLWESDPEAHEKKVVVKCELPCYHILMYEAKRRSFRNHQFFKLKKFRKLNKYIFKHLTQNNNFLLWQNNISQ